MKGAIKNTIAVLALPAIWALGAKTGKGKAVRWILAASLYYSPVSIVKSIASSSIKPVDAAATDQPSGERYYYAFQKQLQSSVRSPDVARSYFAAISNQQSDWDGFYDRACEEYRQYKGDVQSIGQDAYQANSANGSPSTIDEYLTYNQIKFNAAAQAGCTP